MTNNPDNYVKKLIALTATKLPPESFEVPADYQKWIDAFHTVVRPLRTSMNTMFITINESKELLKIRPVWALTFAEKRFKAKRLLPTMISGVFDNHRLGAWAFERELFVLDRKPVLCERVLDANGMLQVLTLVGQQRGNTLELQNERRTNRVSFKEVKVTNVGRSPIGMERLLGVKIPVYEGFTSGLIYNALNKE